MLAGPVAAWSDSDVSYTARDDVDGGPTNDWSTYDYESSSGWTCPSTINVDTGATGNILPTGFSFSYYGTAITNLRAASDGYLSTSAITTSDYTADKFPTTTDPDGVIGPWWGDLSPNTGAKGYACYRTETIGGEDVFEYLQDNTRHLGTPATARVNTVALLYEDSDAIEFHYGATTYLNDGFPEAIGIEDGTGANGISYKFSGTTDATAIDASNRGVQFRPKTSFPTATADSYSLDWSAEHTLKVDGSSGRDKLTKNDKGIGHVAIYPTYVSGLDSTGRLYTLGSGSCGTTSPNLSSDGQFCFTSTDSNPCSHSPYTFKYRADDAFPDDASASPVDVATVTITVTNCNRPPVARADNATAIEDTTLNGTGLLSNDSDPDSGDTITAELVPGSVTPSGATATVTSQGNFTYTPPADVCAAATGSFRYRAKDDHGAYSNATTVRIAIACTPDTPVAVNDTYTLDEDGLLTRNATTGVRGNDADADTGRANEATDGLGLAHVVLDSDVAHGTLVLSGDGSFVYTPDADFAGTDQFSYHLLDGNASYTARESGITNVTLEVAAVNDAPRSSADAYSLVLDETLDEPAESGVLANDTDIERGAMTAELLVGPVGGTLTLHPDGAFVYTPDAGRTDPDGFTYRAVDDLGAEGPATRVTLAILIPNPDLIARSDRYNATEDTRLAVAAPGVLATDLVADRTDALAIVVDTPPAHGVLAVAADGSFVYTPAADFNGLDGFRYHLEQSRHGASNVAKVDLRVGSVNDPPFTVVPDYACVAEDALLTRGAATGLLSLASDDHAGAPDEDDTPLSLAAVTTPSHGTLSTNLATGAFTYTPAADYNGPDAFSYRVQDAQGAAGPLLTVDLCVEAKPDAPVAYDDTFIAYTGARRVLPAPGPLSNDRDVDGDALFVDGAPMTLVGNHGGSMAIALNGSLSYTPPGSYTGYEDFTYRAFDGALASTATARIRMDVRYNTPPVAAFSAPARVQANQLFAAADNSHDLDGPLVARSWEFGTPSPPGVTAPQHRYAYPGTYTIRLTVTDEAGASATATRTILVDPASPSSDSTPNPDPSSSGPHDYTTETVATSDVEPEADDAAGTDGDVAASANSGGSATGDAADAPGGDAAPGTPAASLPAVSVGDAVGLAGDVRLAATVDGATSVTWRQVSGPHVDLRGTGAALAFTGDAGSYVFELTASNAAGSVTRTVHVTLESTGAPSGTLRAAPALAQRPADAATPAWAWGMGGIGLLLALGLVVAIVVALRRRA